MKKYPVRNELVKINILCTDKNTSFSVKLTVIELSNPIVLMVYIIFLTTEENLKIG